jgi:hypothetical protein
MHLFDREGVWFVCTIKGCGAVHRCRDLAHNTGIPWLHVCPESGCGGAVREVSEEEGQRLLRANLQQLQREEEERQRQAEADEERRLGAARQRCLVRRAVAEILWLVDAEVDRREFAEAKRQGAIEEARALWVECVASQPTEALVQELTTMLYGWNLGELRHFDISLVVRACLTQFESVLPQVALDFILDQSNKWYLEAYVNAFGRGWTISECFCNRPECAEIVVSKPCLAYNAKATVFNMILDQFEIERQRALIRLEAAGDKPNTFAYEARRLMSLLQGHGMAVQFELEVWTQDQVEDEDPDACGIISLRWPEEGVDINSQTLHLCEMEVVTYWGGYEPPVGEPESYEAAFAGLFDFVCRYGMAPAPAPFEDWETTISETPLTERRQQLRFQDPVIRDLILGVVYAFEAWHGEGVVSRTARQAFEKMVHGGSVLRAVHDKATANACDQFADALHEILVGLSEIEHRDPMQRVDFIRQTGRDPIACGIELWYLWQETAETPEEDRVLLAIARQEAFFAHLVAMPATSGFLDGLSPAGEGLLEIGA